MPNPNVVLIVRPNFDIATNYGFYNFGELVYEARELGYEVIDISDETAVYETMDEAIIAHDPKYVFIVTHGCPNLLVGDNFNGLAWIPPGCESFPRNDRTIDNLKGRQVYFLACDAGRGLIPAISSVGGEMAIGFDDIWGWIAEPPDYDPSTDVYATSFFKAGNVIPLTLLGGGTPQEAYSNYVAECDRWISYWRDSDLPLASFCEAWFIKNRESIVVYENGMRLTAGSDGGGISPILLAVLALIGLSLFAKTD